MNVYTKELKARVRKLRSDGLMYPEICKQVGVQIPKGTLSYMCRGIVLSSAQRKRIYDVMSVILEENRLKAVAANKRILRNKIDSYKHSNANIESFMQSREAKLVALSILYLGEGSKWASTRALRLGSSDPGMLRLYIGLLEECFGIGRDVLKCKVQHRADQDPEILIEFWASELRIPKAQFYPCFIDKRTIGKPTKKPGYHGVCAVYCAGTNVQLEIAEIAAIIVKTVGH